MATLHLKTIVVFGGSSGIGYSVAETSLTSRASRVIIVSLNPMRVKGAVQRLQSHITKMGLTGDVQGEVVNAKDHTALIKFVKRIGEVDHIVYTSGDSPEKLRGFPVVSAESAKDIFDVRFWGPVVITQNAKICSSGSLTLTIGSVFAKPFKSYSIRAGVVSAVDSLTCGLAVDLAPVHMNVISPGIVRLWDGVPDAVKESRFSEAAEKLLVKHVADPDEIAEAYLFVMKCSFIMGQCIEVDGGYVLGA
ncbi:NAD-binding protein [Ramaria rubella]|nr:NAD-binding protein [Ramaria rubella]